MDPVIRFQCRDSSLEIYVIQPGERLTIYGSCSVLCLAGNATINDYNLPCVSCEEANFLKISAPQRMEVPALLQVGTSSSSYKHARLKFRLKEVNPQGYEQIMERIGNTKPAVLVFRKNLDVAEETVAGILPNFLLHSSLQKQVILPPYYHTTREDFAILPHDDESKLKRQLDLLNNEIKDGRRTSILPFGHKGAGKSNLMRSLVNRCLSRGFDNVYVLDCDIGQSEFTPSGCLSLNKVTSPLLDKPYGHQKKKFDHAFFLGDITVQTVEPYLNVFESLWNKFETVSEPGSVCIINTMGWVVDKGAEILNAIIQVAEPDLFVEIHRDPQESRYCFPALNKYRNKFVQIYANNSTGVVGLAVQKKLPAHLHRDLTTVGYFSSILPRPSLVSFPKVAPYKLKFRNTKLCIPIDLLVEDCHILSSINTQIMAICRNTSDVETRRLCGKEEMPSLCIIKEFFPILECVGFGIVRGIDIEEGFIYVVSPFDLRELEEAPVLVRGMRIQTPSMFFTADPYNRCPYVLSLPEKGSSSNKNLNCLYEPVVNTTQFKRSRRV